MIKYRNVQPNDVIDIISMADFNASSKMVDGYRLDRLVWSKQIIEYLEESLAGRCLFKVAVDVTDDEEMIVGFNIGHPTQWHYSSDLYLDLVETIVDEALSTKEKADIVQEFMRIAEEEARQAGLKGMSIYSIRENAQGFSNFFEKRLGWTPVGGAKKIFE